MMVSGSVPYPAVIVFPELNTTASKHPDTNVIPVTPATRGGEPSKELDLTAELDVAPTVQRVKQRMLRTPRIRPPRDAVIVLIGNPNDLPLGGRGRVDQVEYLELGGLGTRGLTFDRDAYLQHCRPYRNQRTPTARLLSLSR
jgi:hypothetical protein